MSLNPDLDVEVFEAAAKAAAASNCASKSVIRRAKLSNLLRSTKTIDRFLILPVPDGCGSRTVKGTNIWVSMASEEEGEEVVAGREDEVGMGTSSKASSSSSWSEMGVLVVSEAVVVESVATGST